MKKINLLLIILILFSISFQVGGISSDWIYYEGIVDSVETQLDISLGEFYYGLRPGFENNESGQSNNNALDNIEGSNNINSPGLENAFSDLNKALSDGNLPESNFITSVDIVPNANSGAKYKKDLFNDENSQMNFIINKESENFIGSKQVWTVFTTDFDISKLKVNGKGEITPKYIYPIYKTTYTWESEVGRYGKYTQKGNSVLGYASSSINTINNPNIPFFNPKDFKPGKFIPINDFTLEGPSELTLGEKVYLKTQISPNNVTDKTIVYESNKPKLISVNKYGQLKALKYKENEEVIIKATALDTGLVKYLKVKVVIPQPDTTISGDVIIDENGNVEIKAKEVSEGEEGYIFPSEQYNQSLTITVPTNFYIQKDLIEIYSDDPNAMIIEAKYLDQNNVIKDLVIDNPKKITVVGTGIMDSVSYDRKFIITVKANKPVHYRVIGK